MSDRVGEHLGNYRLLRLLGRGSFAEVYLGEHDLLKTQAAIKLLHPQLTDEDAEHFLREAQKLARLNHPHIVRVLDFAVQEGTPFLVMEYAPGGSLRMRHPKQTPLPLDTIVGYVSQVASALQYAHDHRLIHRDVKPENMLLDSRDEVLLSDFGLAIFASHTHPYSTLELPQQMAGTSPYLAPEQLLGRPQPQSDQYALGIVVYEWLTGKLPFHGTLIEVAMQHLSLPPPSLHEQVPDLPPALEEVVLRALAKKPEHRFAFVHDFAIALQGAVQTGVSLHSTPLPISGSAADSPRPSGTVPVAPVQEPLPSQHKIVTLSSRQIAVFGQTATINLPAQLTPLIGREHEVVQLCDLLQRPAVRLVTLTGPGGVGKTRLGVAAAGALLEAFPDGVCFVSLAPVSEPERVIPAIAQALGLWEAADRPLQEQVQDYLRQKRLLLLLDNFEQVLAAAPQLTHLLISCSHLSILVTSRAALRLSGEHELAVSPLAIPDLTRFPISSDLAQVATVRLFVERAQAVKANFQLTEANAHAIAEICVRLDGLPLAIELAAARIKLLPPQALLTRLSHRLEVLTSGPQDLPARQQTLRNTLQWSYDLLSHEEQELFRWLSVFVGGFSLDAAVAVYNRESHPTPNVLNRVASLLDKSLLQQTEQQGEEPRLLMLETIREYGLERLDAHGEGEAARQSHAAYYLHLAQEAHSHLFGAEAARWFERLMYEYENLRVALQWALEGEDEETGSESRTETAVRLASALWRFWIVQGYMSEGRIFLEQVLTKSEKSKESVRIKALVAAVTLAWYQEDYAWEEVVCEELLPLSQRLADRQAEAIALYALAGVARYRHDHAKAHSLCEQALAMFRALGDSWLAAAVLLFLARLSSAREEDAETQQQLEESLVHYRALGYPGDIAWPLIYLARQAIKLGEQARAQVLLQEAVGLCREVGDKWALAHALGFLGELRLEQNELVGALALLTESLRLTQEAGNRRSIAWSLFMLANAIALQGDLAEARPLYEQSLAIVIALGHRGLIASCLQGLAAVMTTQGLLLPGAQLWGAAETARQGSLTSLPPSVRASTVQAQAVARTQLGEVAFAKTLAEGRRMTPEQILAVLERATAHPPMQTTLQQPLTEPASAPPAKAPSSPAGLTSREVEVLCLLAQGLTNPQIAERLVISLTTVNTHVGSIYNKLAVSSRSAATRYAVEHHLV